MKNLETKQKKEKSIKIQKERKRNLVKEDNSK